MTRFIALGVDFDGLSFVDKVGMTIHIRFVGIRNDLFFFNKNNLLPLLLYENGEYLVDKRK